MFYNDANFYSYVLTWTESVFDVVEDWVHIGAPLVQINDARLPEVPVMRTLIEAKANIHAVDKEGNTALWGAMCS